MPKVTQASGRAGTVNPGLMVQSPSPSSPQDLQDLLNEEMEDQLLYKLNLVPNNFW